MERLATVTPQPGSVVVVDFPGAVVVKRRPAVVLSTTTYHTQRPDVSSSNLMGICCKL
ncbi:MAG: hypothetical protein QME81_11120 [bacterium]|nr:hypothetical protein [bacterium]